MAKPVNRDKVDQWKADVVESVDLYNSWFMEFAPKAFRETRIETTKQVEADLKRTQNLTDISPDLLIEHPDVVQMLRMTTCPPIARDRLTGLAGLNASLLSSMEDKKQIPPRMAKAVVRQEMEKIGTIIEKLADPDIFVWLNRDEAPTEAEVHRAATIVADRLCGAVTNPIIRNAQEQRQLAIINAWLQERGYSRLDAGSGIGFRDMPPGTFSFRMNVPVYKEDGKKVNLPVDAVIMRKNAKPGDMPLLIEAKSAGDFTNVNKRRKEEAQKMHQLLAAYGADVEFALFLCGYFDTGYLGYEAAEGIDWVWEHRVDDLAEFEI